MWSGVPVIPNDKVQSWRWVLWLAAAASALSVAALTARHRLGARRPSEAWPAGTGPPPLSLVRCPIHGIAYDADKETCPGCAAGVA
jgi:DNA-binding helix-hairpin-helix protein with protein kinase domain